MPKEKSELLLSRLKFLLLLLYLIFFCIINFTITIFSTLFLSPSLSLHFWSYNTLFSPQPQQHKSEIKETKKEIYEKKKTTQYLKEKLTKIWKTSEKRNKEKSWK
jgi:hypothetical protein